jgi:delta-aminolevulinic acid dehydratase/porphobilinogen synthase
MKEFLKPIEGAHEAEQLLFLQKDEKKSQADKIIANPVKYASEFYNPEKVVELAQEAKKGLTMGMKTESRGIDTLENIATGSFFGADELIGRKEALAFVGQTLKKII